VGSARKIARFGILVIFTDQFLTPLVAKATSTGSCKKLRATAATAAITTAAMQAIIKLRIPVVPSRIITQGKILELRRSSVPII